VLHGSEGRRGRLRVFDGGRDRLLSVKEVAARLGVCTATVYALVERGELAHIRVVNAIRVAPPTSRPSSRAIALTGRDEHR
jgi:excisionase family DNA binding protein